MYTDVYIYSIYIIHVKIYIAYMHSLEILSGSFGTILDFKGGREHPTKISKHAINSSLMLHLAFV